MVDNNQSSDAMVVMHRRSLMCVLHSCLPWFDLVNGGQPAGLFDFLVKYTLVIAEELQMDWLYHMRSG